MTDIAYGSITLSLAKAAQDLGALAVYVHESSGLLVGEGHSGSPIQVAPGRYLVKLRLPDGREQFADDMVDVAPGSAVALTMPIASKAAMTRMETRANPRRVGRARAEPGLQSFLWSGRLLGTELGTIALSTEVPGPNLDPVAQHDMPAPDPARDQLLILRYADDLSGARCRLSVLPADFPMGDATTRDAARPVKATLAVASGPPLLRFASDISKEANTLISYIENSGLRDVQRAAEGCLTDTGATGAAKRQSVLHVMAAIYVMLRVDSLDKVGPAIDRLARFAAIIPDCHIVRAEWMARLGRHEEAVASLEAAIAGGGCPWFRSGLVYLADRLRQYLAIDGSKADRFNLANRTIFKDARTTIEPYLSSLVSGPLFTTFDVVLEGAIAEE